MRYKDQPLGSPEERLRRRQMLENRRVKRLTRHVSMRASIVSGGKIPGIRRASMVLPEPGGPLITICVPFATRPRLLLSDFLGQEPKVEVALV